MSRAGNAKGAIQKPAKCNALLDNKAFFLQGTLNGLPFEEKKSYSSINKNTGNGLVTSPLDISKAFECVERQAPHSELVWYGISTHWIENYFTGRTETVKEDSKAMMSHLK